MTRDVAEKKSWPEATSVAGPAAVQMPGGRPVLAWRGDKNSRNLTLAVIEGPPGSLGASNLHRYKCSDSSDYAPALCYFGGLQLAWAGTNAARTVNLAMIELPFGGTHVQFHQRAFVNGGHLGAGASGPPSLADLSDGRLDLLCRDASGRMCGAGIVGGVSVSGSGNEMFWKPACLESAVRIKSPTHPGNYYVAWTDANTKQLQVIHIDALDIMHAPVSSAQSSQHAPSLAIHDRKIYVAWVGTDADAHLNVAPLDEVAIQNGTDPIGPALVDTLNEMSIAGPALLTLPPTKVDRFTTLPERMAIFWTGVDGAGTLSGAIV